MLFLKRTIASNLLNHINYYRVVSYIFEINLFFDNAIEFWKYENISYNLRSSTVGLVKTEFDKRKAVCYIITNRINRWL
jgi:hypothetical protein